MILSRKQAGLLGVVLLVLLALLAINIMVPFGPRVPAPATSGEKLKIVSAKMHPANAQGKRLLEFSTDRPILGDTSYKVIFGTKTGYMIEGTGLLTSSDKVAGPNFHINVLDHPRFNQPKMVDEHVKAGNLFWVDISIYRREYLHDPDVFEDSRRVAQARFEEP